MGDRDILWKVRNEFKNRNGKTIQDLKGSKICARDQHLENMSS